MDARDAAGPCGRPAASGRQADAAGAAEVVVLAPDVDEPDAVPDEALLDDVVLDDAPPDEAPLDDVVLDDVLLDDVLLEAPVDPPARASLR